MKNRTDELKAFAEKIFLPPEAWDEVKPVCERWNEAFAENYERIKTNAFVEKANAEIEKEIKTFAKKRENRKGSGHAGSGSSARYGCV